MRLEKGGGDDDASALDAELAAMDAVLARLEAVLKRAAAPTRPVRDRCPLVYDLDWNEGARLEELADRASPDGSFAASAAADRRP